MSELDYTHHESDEGLEQVDSMCLTGMRVMVGRWDDGTGEILTSKTMPWDAVDAQIAFDDGEL